MSQYRIDRGGLKRYRRDDNGNVIAAGVLTRTGVFRYTHRDGRVTRELRHPDDVFNQDSVASFIQLPITLNHPREGKVTPENFKRLGVGNLGDSVGRDGKNMVADCIIRDHGAIKAVMGEGVPAMRELSNGYTADVVPEVGVYEGEHYDHRQTNIRGNHVAIVRHGRAGPSARLLMDAADAICEDEQELPEFTGEEGRQDVEGARGGHVIGHSKSGKPIYSDHGNAEHAGFSGMDHVDASIAHHNLEEYHRERARNHARVGYQSLAMHDIGIAEHHAKMKTMHRKSAAERNDGLSEADQDALSAKIKKIKEDHPDWENDRAVAAAYSMLGLNEGKNKNDSSGDAVMTLKIQRPAVQVGDFRMDDLEITCDEKDEGTIKALLSRCDTLVEHIRVLHADREELAGQVDALESSQALTPERLDAIGKERQEIVEVGRWAGLKLDEITKLDNAEVKRAACNRRFPGKVKADVSDERVDGMFDVLLGEFNKQISTRKTHLQAGRYLTAPHSTRQDDDGKEETEEERKKREAEKKNDGMTYRERAMQRMDGMHNLTDSQLRERFPN